MNIYGFILTNHKTYVIIKCKDTSLKGVIMKDKITVNAQSSIRIEAEKIIYFDPFKIAIAANDADVIFITHDHPDHFSPEDIRKVQKTNTTFVIPKSMENTLKKAGYSDLILFTPGEKAAVYDIPVEAIPAYNMMKPFHKRENGWLGYIITIDGQRIYVAGDTDAASEAKAVSCDIAIIPIGGTFTMNHSQAAAFINELHPKTVIPTHYGSIVGSADSGEAFRKLVQPDIEVIIKLGLPAEN